MKKWNPAPNLYVTISEEIYGTCKANAIRSKCPFLQSRAKMQPLTVTNAYISKAENVMALFDQAPACA